MLTCKDFLQELSDYLDEGTDVELKSKLEKHMSECPNCWVVYDTTRRTVEIYKGHEKQCCVPPDVQTRLMAAMERKMASRAEKPEPRPDLRPPS